jgi:dienelactone hydrolase
MRVEIRGKDRAFDPIAQGVMIRASMKWNGLILGLLGMAMVASTRAEIVTKAVEYKEGGTTLEGFVAYDSNVKAARPGVLIVHQWKGLGDYEKMRARMLAEMGYVAFACDIYGKGVRPSSMQEAGAQAGKYKNDRALLRKRVQAGLETLLTQPGVDKRRVAAIGYCFGGTTVLELARSGADVAGIVSFHGGLSTPTPEDAKNIKCKVLACHGADDPNVPPAEVAGFEKEMRDAKVDWELIAYGNAVHAFTDKSAGNDNSKGVAYNEKADRRSWQAMKDFFGEIFK